MNRSSKALCTLSVIALSTMFAAGCGNTNQTNSSAAKNAANQEPSQASKIQKNSVIGTAQLMLPNKGKCGVASLTLDRKAKTLSVAIDVQNLSPKTPYVVQITDSKANKLNYRFPSFTTDKQGDAIVFHQFSKATTLTNTMQVQIIRAGATHVMAEGTVKVTLTT